mgnify:CR=1 FL=1
MANFRCAGRGQARQDDCRLTFSSLDDALEHFEAEDHDLQPDHTKDEDCTVDLGTHLCSVCGVIHGDPCRDCSGRGFHLPECPQNEKVTP